MASNDGTPGYYDATAAARRTTNEGMPTLGAEYSYNAEGPSNSAGWFAGIADFYDGSNATQPNHADWNGLTKFQRFIEGSDISRWQSGARNDKGLRKKKPRYISQMFKLNLTPNGKQLVKPRLFFFW